jgi:hypothetical protein
LDAGVVGQVPYMPVHEGPLPASKPSRVADDGYGIDLRPLKRHCFLDCPFGSRKRVDDEQAALAVSAFAKPLQSTNFHNFERPSRLGGDESNFDPQATDLDTLSGALFIYDDLFKHDDLCKMAPAGLHAATERISFDQWEAAAPALLHHRSDSPSAPGGFAHHPSEDDGSLRVDDGQISEDDDDDDELEATTDPLDELLLLLTTKGTSPFEFDDVSPPS